MIPKDQPVRSKKLREAARDSECTLRLPGVCEGGTETTVLAHAPFGGRGMARKASDLHAVHACHSCHQVLDGHWHSAIPRDELLECVIRGIAETQDRLVQAGHITVR